MKTRRLRASAGFTLLEVLVAVAILGLGLTTILSAQTGIFASADRTEKLSFAIGLLRCRMSEIEVGFMKLGFPAADEKNSGPCCEDEEDKTFTCYWRVETVTLPEPTELGISQDGGAPAAPSSTSMGAMGALEAVAQSEGRVLGSQPDLSSLADLMGSGMSSDSMAPMVMSMVYPTLKPMLEASIRRVTVNVKWKEGVKDRELVATQFVTRPQQGGFVDSTSADAVTNMADDLINQMPTLPPASTTSTKTGGGARK